MKNKNKEKPRLEIFRWKGIVYHQKYKNEIFIPDKLESKYINLK